MPLKLRQRRLTKEEKDKIIAWYFEPPRYSALSIAQEMKVSDGTVFNVIKEHKRKAQEQAIPSQLPAVAVETPVVLPATTETPKKTGRPTKAADAAIQAKLVEMFDAGKSQREIAQTFKLSRMTVARVLQREGKIKPTNFFGDIKLHKLTGDIKQQILDLHIKEKLPVSEISKRLKISEDDVWNVRMANPRARSKEQTKKITDTTRRQILALYNDEHLDAGSIAEQLLIPIE